MPVAGTADMKRILVGVDLSPESELAVASAVDHARRIGAEVVLAMADAFPLEAEGASESAATAAKVYNDVIRRQLELDRGQLGALRERWDGHGAEISQILLDGWPDEELARRAAELGAELIVVGSHGRTGVKRLVLGSTAERVIRLAGVSVLVARGAAPSGGYRRIVVGTDFTPLARQAALAAIGYAGAGGRIDVVHCWSRPATAAGLDVPITLPWGAMVTELERIGAAHVAELRRETDVPIDFRVAQLAPDHGLVEVAERTGADLIVVGSHGRRGVKRFLLGSVAERTARHAPCSTLVVR
jgi:nucleotide-binding universal stress UspA family protein